MMKMIPYTCVCALVAAGIGAWPAGAQSATDSRGKTKPAPLFDNLGDLHHPITTSSPKAQRYFDQGLILLYGFNHAEAIRSFLGAAAEDPVCAMAWWGVAHAYGPNINAPMETNAVPKAWDALQKALSLKSNASANERAYIDALSKRYQAAAPADRAELDRAYMEAMREVSRQYPDDLDASVLFAESIMDTMPWAYWTPDLKPKPDTESLLAALRHVLRRDPLHPGANHLFIHAVEAGPTPESGIPSADRLGEFAPGAGHLVHMPSHIYMRVGEYAKATQANLKAVKADEKYISHCRAQGFYPGVYYPHNAHFLWFAFCYEGRSKESIASAKKVAEYALDGRCGVLEGPRLRHLPLLAQARFGKWDEILGAPEPSEYPYDKAMWHYARGVAFAAKRQADDTASEHQRFKQFAASDEVKAMDNPALPATGILKVADAVLAARAAEAAEKWDEAAALFRKAVEAEEELPYMEPPFWYYPVRQSLGAVLLRANKPAEAEAVFREDLKKMPRNGWSLHGLAVSLERQGDLAAAYNVRRELGATWRKADVALDLSWY